MKSTQYSGNVYYCLCNVNTFHMEVILSDLQDDTDFLSQVWSTADFALIWGWVQKGFRPMEFGMITSGSVNNEGFFQFLNERFTFDVATTAGRVIKRDVCALHAVACGNAHVRMKTVEKVASPL